MSQPDETRSAANERRCPRCKGVLLLIDPAEEDWFDAADAGYDEDDEVWVCEDCSYHEWADPEDALEYHAANLEWIAGKLAQIEEAKADA